MTSHRDRQVVSTRLHKSCSCLFSESGSAFESLHKRQPTYAFVYALDIVHVVRQDPIFMPIVNRILQHEPSWSQRSQKFINGGLDVRFRHASRVIHKQTHCRHTRGTKSFQAAYDKPIIRQLGIAMVTSYISPRREIVVWRIKVGWNMQVINRTSSRRMQQAEGTIRIVGSKARPIGF